MTDATRRRNYEEEHPDLLQKANALYGKERSPIAAIGGHYVATASEEEALDPESKPVRQLSETMLRTRSGTREEAYERVDGVRTLRITCTVPEGIVDRERVFAAALKPPWTRNKWFEWLVVRGMSEHNATAGGIPYPHEYFRERDEKRKPR